MPIYKPELTRGSRQNIFRSHENSLPRGSGLDIPDEWRENERFLRITIAGSPESLITQLSPSKVLYALRVRLLAERSGTVQGFEVETCWDQGVFPCYPEGRAPYRFAPGLDFDFDEVLNHRIESLLRFRRGDVCEGWLLAMGYKPIPESTDTAGRRPLILYCSTSSRSSMPRVVSFLLSDQPGPPDRRPGLELASLHRRTHPT